MMTSSSSFDSSQYKAMPRVLKIDLVKRRLTEKVRFRAIFVSVVFCCRHELCLRIRVGVVEILRLIARTDRYFDELANH